VRALRFSLLVSALVAALFSSPLAAQCPMSTAAQPSASFDANDIVLIDDSFPAGVTMESPSPNWTASQFADGSQSFAHPTAPSAGNHYMGFYSMSPAQQIHAGDKLVVYVLIDSCNPATQIEITWKGSLGWKIFYWGTNANNSMNYVGPLPAAGSWARLEVDADTFGLASSTYNGMTFNHVGGRVWFDRAGKKIVPCSLPADQSPAVAPGVNDIPLVEDAFPVGTTVPSPGASWDTTVKLSGTQSFYHPNSGGTGHHYVSFSGASPAQQIETGEKLFVYGMIDSCAFDPTQRVELTWYTSLGWKTFTWGGSAVSGATYMGALPTAGKWFRFEVDADTAGLVGATYNGLSVNNMGGKMWWDFAGKTVVPCTPGQSSPAAPLTANDVLLVDDAFPAGVSVQAPGEIWDTNVKMSGTKSYTHPAGAGTGHHYIFFHGVSPAEQIEAGEKLFVYVLLDSCATNPTQRLELTWTTSLGWKTFTWGGSAVSGATYMGALPAAGQWARLEVDADAAGLAGATYNGLSVNNLDGRAWWDAAGKTIVPCSTQTPGTPVAAPLASDGVWFEDTFQAPGIVDAPGALWDTTRNVSGNASLTMPAASYNGDGHNYIFAHGYNTPPFRVNADDKLLFYYSVDECDTPQQIMVTWTSSNGYRTAYLGDALTFNNTIPRIGDIGAGGQWHRVEVPAATLGLAGHTVNGLNVDSYGGRVWFDRIGRVCPTPDPVGGTPDPDAAETIWIDDALPTGATQVGDGAWSTAYAASGGQSIAIDGGYGIFEHEINGATSTLVANSGESLFAYVLINECNPPKELVLSWRDAVTGNWKSAFWGTDTLYSNGNNSQLGFYRMGAIPKTNRWVKLEVNPDRLGLTGVAIDGFKVESVDGQFWFDRVGKSSQPACAGLDPVANTSWMWDEILMGGDDTAPAGATVSANWTWDSSQQATGTSSHTDGFSFGAHEHSYTGANGTAFIEWDYMSVWVMIDPCNPVREIMLGTNNHYVSWGEDLLPVPSGATKSTIWWEGLPEAGTWYRLWFPAYMLDIEGTTVTEFSFAAYDGQVWFDRLARIAAWADVTSMTADQPSPITAGTSITYTTTATGEPPVEYRFELRNLATNTYTVMQDWSTTNTWTWTPTTADAGNYYVYGMARNAGSQWEWEDYEVLPLTVNP